MSQRMLDDLQNGTNHLSLDDQSAVGILQHLRKDELQSLLDDDHKLEQLIQDSDLIIQIKQAKQMLMVGNKSVAEYNLSKEEQLIYCRNMLAELYGQVEDLITNVQKKKFHLESQGDIASLDTILALLETEAAKTEEHSEELSERLLESQMDVSEFVESYMATRTRMYQQKVKAEKLFELMHQKI